MQEPEEFNRISSKVIQSKLHFDGDLGSKPFSVMNALFYFTQSNNRRQFCKKFALSYTRLNQLLTYKKNLQQRAAKILSMEMSQVIVQKPPKHMPDSKLMALRVIFFWVFQSFTIKLNSTNSALIDEDSFKISITGDQIEERHLAQVLHSKKHPFSLLNTFQLSYNGSFDPAGNLFDEQEYYERLLSIAIEKKFQVIVTRVGNTTSLILSKSYKDIFEQSKMSAFSSEDIICYYRNEKSVSEWEGRSCGEWRFKILGKDYSPFSCYEDDTIFLQRIKHFSKPKKAKKYYREICDSFQRNTSINVNILCLNIDFLHGGVFQLHCFTNYFIDFELLDLKDLLRTTSVKLVDPIASVCQKISFQSNAKTVAGENSTTFFKSVIPVGARILGAIAWAKQKPSIKFCDSKKAITNESKYIEIQLENLFPNSWKTMMNDGLYVDAFSLAMIVKPKLAKDLYACCGNLTYLRSGGIVAKNIIIFPGGYDFLRLAMRSSGMVSSEDADAFPSDVYEVAANELCTFFQNSVRENELSYSAFAISFFCKAFSKIQGYSLVSWDEDIRKKNS